MCGNSIAAENHGTRLVFNEGELYFQEPVTEQQATELGEFLVEMKFFDGTPKTVQLLEANEQFQVRFVIDPKAANDPSTQEVFRNFGGFISTLVFEKQAIEMHLTDENLRTIGVLPIKASI